MGDKRVSCGQTGGKWQLRKGTRIVKAIVKRAVAQLNTSLHRQVRARSGGIRLCGPGSSMPRPTGTRTRRRGCQADRIWWRSNGLAEDKPFEGGREGEAMR